MAVRRQKDLTCEVSISEIIHHKSHVYCPSLAVLRSSTQIFTYYETIRVTLYLWVVMTHKKLLIYILKARIFVNNRIRLCERDDFRNREHERGVS